MLLTAINHILKKKNFITLNYIKRQLQFHQVVRYQWKKLLHSPNSKDFKLLRLLLGKNKLTESLKIISNGLFSILKNILIHKKFIPDFFFKIQNIPNLECCILKTEIMRLAGRSIKLLHYSLLLDSIFCLAYLIVFSACS